MGQQSKAESCLGSILVVMDHIIPSSLNRVRCQISQSPRQETSWVDSRVRELILISLLAFGRLALAWPYEADYFAMFFAVAGANAGVEAMRLSL